jgi:hypothetical protein
LFAHLRGEVTLGAYLLDQDSRARFLVLDADDAQSWQQLGHLARALASEEVPTYSFSSFLSSLFFSIPNLRSC